MQADKQATESLLHELRDDLNSLQLKLQSIPITPSWTVPAQHPLPNLHSLTNEATALTALNHEKEIQATKRKNVAIKGLPPSTSTDDLKSVAEIINDLNCNIGSTTPKIRRTGKHNDLLIVTLTEKLSSQLIKRAKNLRNFEKWNGIFLNPDLTKAQMETQYLLRQALRQKKESEPNETWIIKNNKIQAKKTE